MIYVPSLDYKCYVVQSENTIRAYEEMPQNNREVSYRDYYLKSNYIYRDGIQSFGSYTTLPACLEMSVLTDSFYYRNDFSSILIIFLIMFIFVIYFPYRVISRFFGRWLKV